MEEQSKIELKQESQPSPFVLIFMALRLLLFMVAISFGAFTTLPLEGFLTALTYQKLFGGVALAVILIGVLVYAFRVPRTSIVSSALDLEAIVVIAISTLVMIIAGFVTISISGGKNFLTFAVILMAIYTFYLYKALYGALKIQRENEVLKRKHGELLEIDKEKSNFITITSHQLRTPLTEIKWALSAVVERELDGTTRGVIQKSLDSINRLVDIVNGMIGTAAAKSDKSDLSDLAATKSDLAAADKIGGADKKEKPIDLPSLIEEIMGDLNFLIAQKETAVNFTPTERKVVIRGDREKIKLALRNVIDNAIRYSPQGKINIACRIEAENASIRIEDSGIGIAPEDTERVFRKFFRGKNALLVQPDGSGMGLFTAQKIIDEHGGKISFISTLGKGTIFLVTLPLSKEGS